MKSILLKQRKAMINSFQVIKVSEGTTSSTVIEVKDQADLMSIIDKYKAQYGMNYKIGAEKGKLVILMKRV